MTDTADIEVAASAAKDTVSDAPDYLEDVRKLINTWHIPNDTRVATDDLPGLAADEGAWRARFADLPLVPADGLRELTELREELRSALGVAPTGLNRWLRANPVQVRVAEDGGIEFECYRDDAVGQVLAMFAQAQHRDQWRRLRACGDCQWAFFDSSKNNARRWCRMYGREKGRACGSIAKVRAYRERVKQQSGQAPS
jgi:hypothetical protein